MRSTFILHASTAGLAVLVAGASLAQSADPVVEGKAIYEDRCAICHGPGGKGDGAVGTLFENSPGDLTQLQAENRFFPYMEVLAKIDGRELVIGHGTEMPVWGEYLMVEALEDRGINPKDAAQIVSGRLSALVFYLSTLQEN